MIASLPRRLWLQTLPSRVALLALMLLAGAGAARGATLENFRLGNWLVGAYSNDATGQFSHCGMSASYKSGILMLFGIGRDFHWDLGFADMQWNLTPGGSYEVAMQIDGGAPIAERAAAVSRQQVVIPLQDSAALFERFRRGYQLHVHAAGQDFFFNLNGTARGLSAVLNCAQRYAAAATPSLSTNPFVASGTPANPAQRAPLIAEATAFTANLLSQAGIEKFRILQKDEAPKKWAGFDVVWAAPGVVGIVTVIAAQPALGPGEIRSHIVGSDAAACRGKFASGAVPGGDAADGSGPLEFFTACGARASSWAAYYTLVPRRAGGYYLVGAVGSGTDTDSARTAEDNIRTATSRDIAR